MTYFEIDQGIPKTINTKSTRTEKDITIRWLVLSAVDFENSFQAEPIQSFETERSDATQFKRPSMLSTQLIGSTSLGIAKFRLNREKKMPTSLPYLSSNKNLPTLFEKIKSAKIPGKFNRDFLQDTIGLKGSNDRQYIPFLRTLGFTDQSGTPTTQYRLLKSEETARTAIAQAICSAYAPLFEADEKANALPLEKLKGLVAQVAGTDDEMTARIASTFNSMTKLGDFSFTPSLTNDEENEEKDEDSINDGGDSTRKRIKGLRPDFHYNIQIHLPSNASEDVYLSIFNALRKVFQ